MTEPVTDRIAKSIARRQMHDLDGLALCGHPTRFVGKRRKIVAHSLRLAARDVIEREVAAREAA